MFIWNSLDIAAVEGSFGSLSAASHVRTNSKASQMGFPRPGASASGEYVPLLHREFSFLPFLPNDPYHQLPRSQSLGTLPILLRCRSNLTRNSLQSRAIYLRGFISTDASPDPVGAVVAAHEPPITLALVRSLFSLS